MPVSDSFRAYALEQLGRAVPRIRARSMFGGVGVYSDTHFFALLASDVLYLKVDDTNRADFESRGLGPFRPFDEHGEVMSYYAVDDAILEDVDELRRWAAKSIDVARRKKTKSARRRPRKRS